MAERRQVLVVGGGIVGMATALALLQQRPGLDLLVIDKEPALGAHQTGHNSGVIHSGIYYRPGTRRARLAVEGARSMLAFCREHALPHRVIGKVIVAVDDAERERLRALHQRGLANGVAGLALLDQAALRAVEPEVAGIEALHLAQGAITDYGAVLATMADLVRAAGGEVRLGVDLAAARREGARFRADTGRGVIEAEVVVTAAGLQADRVARALGARPRVRIVPFRGEYHLLSSAAAARVRGLVYPVPDPRLPFLGVHLTPLVGGGVEAGPNAVLALAREGYRWRDVSPRDLAATLAFPGFWRMARRHWRSGLDEAWRSLSRRAFAAAVRRLLPALADDDLTPGGAGVRAQALHPDGALADDFVIESVPGAVLVLNAPSPAATASLGIGDEVARQALPMLAR